LNLPWAILLPVIGGVGVLAFHTAGWNRALIRLWSGVAIVLSFASLILLSDPGVEVAWTRVILAVTCAAALISTVASADYPEPHKGLAMILLSLAAVAITCQTESLATLVAAHAAFCFSAMNAVRSRSLHTESTAFSTAVRGHSDSLRWLLPLSLILVATGAAFLFVPGGSDSLAEIARTFHNSYQPEREETRVGTASILGTVSIVLILIGAAIPFAAFPLQFHQSDLFEDHSGWLVIWVAIAGRAQAFVLLWRIAVTTMSGFGPQVQTPLLVISVVSALAGGLLACRSSSLRGLAGNCWLVHGGLLLHCIATGAGQVSVVREDSRWQLPPALETGLFLFVCSSISLVVVLLIDGSLTPAGRREEFDEDLAGLARQRPSAGGALGTALLGFCAVPPLASFWGVLYLSTGSFIPQYEASDSDILIPNAAVLAATVVLIASLLILAARIVNLLSLMFFDEPLRRHEPTGSPSLLIAGVLAAVSILAGLMPGPFLRVIHSAM
jgi:NADH:ubiquinone oxidoreductase subunit 2 (subunit N)